MGGTSITLDYTVGSASSVLFILGGVPQSPNTDFTVSGTTMTLTTSSTGVPYVIYFLGLKIDIGVPADGVIAKAKITTTLIHEHVDTTITAADSVLFSDATGSNANKKSTVQGILDLAGGGWSFVSTVTASTASTLAFTGLEAGYDYQVVGHNLTCSTDLAYLNLQYGTGGGPTYVTSNYKNQTIRSVTTTLSSVGNTSDAHIAMWEDNGIGNASGEEGVFVITIVDPNSTALTLLLGDSYLLDNSGNPRRIIFGGHNTSTTAVTAIKWLLSAGTVSGKFKLYKRANA